MTDCERAAYDAWLAELMRFPLFRMWLRTRRARGLETWHLLRGTWQNERAHSPLYHACGEPRYE